VQSILIKENYMFTLQYAKDPVWNDAEGTNISLIVKWEEFIEEMPFSATSYDPEPWGVDLYNRAKAGEFGEVAPYVAPIQPTIDFEPTPTQSA
jgi:hypothetical protein